VFLDPKSDQIEIVLGLKNDPDSCKRIEKFVRCNGHAGLLEAATTTAAMVRDRQRRADDPDVEQIHDPWSYCISVFNHDAARASATYPYLFLFENGLRARVDAHLARSLGSDWFLRPTTYLPDGIARALTTKDIYREVQDRSANPEAPYPIKPFDSGLHFLRALTLWPLTQIALRIHRQYRLALFQVPTAQAPYDPQGLDRMFAGIIDARNRVSHHLGLSLTEYEGVRPKLVDILTRLEFDADKAIARVSQGLAEVHQHPH
jgi:hypothetical protein